jgi:Xaa-Pro aminopeptidase
MRYKPINPFLFEKNRQKLSRRLPSLSLAIVFSNDEMPRTADQFYPYRQNSDLFYLSGIEQPKTILCICPDYTDHHYHEILFIEKPTKYSLTWHGNKIEKEKASEISGIKNIMWLDDFEHVLNEVMQHAKHIYLTYHEKSRTFDEIPLRDTRYLEKIRNLYPLHHYERLSPFMSELREVKEPEEIDLIKKSTEISVNALKRLIQVLKPGIKECEIEAEIISEFLREGASGHAFLPIIASGINACILHYSLNSGVCNNGDMVLIDFGAEYANYNADITRTFPVNGKFTRRQREIYMAVHRLYEKAIQFIKPGNTIEKINQDMIQFFEEEMGKLNLISQKEIKNQDPENPAYKKYFMHGVSHYLGLDVHDVGNKSDMLLPGMVVTCEPALYVREENIGIRLENDILVTDHGNINLTSQIPMHPDEIEEMLAKRTFLK